MDGEVLQSRLGVCEEATAGASGQPHDLPGGQVDRSRFDLQGACAGEDMDEDVEGRTGVLADLPAGSQRDDVRVEIALPARQLPDGPGILYGVAELGDVEDDARGRCGRTTDDAHSDLILGALERFPSHCIGELSDHLHTQTFGDVIVDEDQTGADVKFLICPDDERMALRLRNGPDVDDGFNCHSGPSQSFRWLFIETITGAMTVVLRGDAKRTAAIGVTSVEV